MLLSRDPARINENSMRVLSYCIIISICLVSCGNSPEYPQEIETIDVVSRRIESELELLDHFNVKFKTLETTFESSIRRIDRVVLVDSSYLVADERLDKLYLFNCEGSFIKSLTPVPKPGPGEFNMIRDITYHDDTVYLNDFRRILKFDKQLRWIETKKLFRPADRIGVIDNKVYCYSTNQFSAPVRLYEYESDLLSDPRIAMTEYRKMGRFHMRQSLNLLKFKDCILLSIFHMDTIYSIEGLSPRPKYRINFVDREFATHYFDNISNNEDTGYLMENLNKTKFAHNIYDFIDHEDFFFFIFILDNKGVYFFKFKDSGESFLSHKLLLDGIPIGVRLNGFYNGRAFFCLEPYEISEKVRSQNPVFHNGFDEYSNPVIMELSFRNE